MLQLPARFLISPPTISFFFFSFFLLFPRFQYIMKPHLGLDPERHCSDCFSRYDKETVAVALADVYGCAF